jgi:hypothetical protein
VTSSPRKASYVYENSPAVRRPLPARSAWAVLTRVLLAALIGAVGVLSGPALSTARAEGTASSVDVTSELTQDGTLTVEQTITFAGTPPQTVQQEYETSEDLVGNRSRHQSLTDITVTAGDQQLDADITDDGDLVTVIFEPGEAESVTISYTVTGAVINNGGTPALHWRLLQGLSLTVEEFTATVGIPGPFSYVRCTSGPPNATTPCNSASAGTAETSSIPTFTDGPRGEGEVVAVDIGFPAGVVTINEEIEEHWTVSRAFSVEPLPLALCLGLLVLGGIALLVAHRRIGRDVGAGGDEIHKPAEFVPVGEGQSEFRVVADIRPGQIGTVVDERVDPVDITATLLDLAVRGHVRITELPAASKYARADWILTRTTDGAETGDQLRPFEQALLDGVVPTGDDSVRVSEVGPRVSASLPTVQSALYDEMVDNHWFKRRPDATRTTWTRLGIGALIAAVVITVVLAAFTQFGLLGLTLIVLALGLMFIGQEMPARTAEGSALLAGLAALRSDLLTTPTDRMPPGRELSELSEVLPYAVVLGGADRWVDAIVAADDDDHPDSTDLSWYHGPDDWHLSDLPDSLLNFVTTVSGLLTAR